MQITGRSWLMLFGLGVALILVGPLLPIVSAAEPAEEDLSISSA